MRNALRDLPPEIRAKILIDEAGCWRWQGTLSRLYGVLKWNGRNQAAHRVVFEILRGLIPEGMTLDHFLRNEDEYRCVKSCVNPEHLQIVSDGQNRWRSPRFREWRNLDTAPFDFSVSRRRR